MGLKASGRRLHAGAVTACFVLALAVVPESAASAAGAGMLASSSPPAGAAQPTPPAQPAATPVDPTLPPLPTVGTDITDGQPVQDLYAKAMSLSDTNAFTTGLLSEIAATQKVLDTAAVQATQAADAEAAADTREATAAARAKAAGAAYAGLEGALRNAVIFMYTAGPTYVTVNPGAGQKLAYAADYASTALTPGGLLSTRRFDASVQKSALAEARAAQKEAHDQAAAAAAALAAQQAAQAKLETQLASVMSTSGPQLVAEKTTLANQAGQELVNASGLEFTPSAPIPAPLSTTAVALSWAFAELGKPYVWAATGPDTFDCSGLTQYIWKQAGVSIPRVAADQDTWTIPVPLSQLLPGDLVFFGTGYIHHVGIYIGDGLMINAPHTGDVVRVSPIWWTDLAGFGRVHDPNTPVPLHNAPTAAKPAPAVVVPAAGPVPSQTAPPPGWQPQAGSTTPISLPTSDGSTPTDPTTTVAPSPVTTPPTTAAPAPTTTVAPVPTTVPAGSGQPTTTTTVAAGA